MRLVHYLNHRSPTDLSEEPLEERHSRVDQHPEQRPLLHRDAGRIVVDHNHGDGGDQGQNEVVDHGKPSGFEDGLGVDLAGAALSAVAGAVPVCRGGVAADRGIITGFSLSLSLASDFRLWAGTICDYPLNSSSVLCV